MQEQIKEIKHKNKVIDNGIILGSRLHKGLLRKRYAPLYAMIDNDFVSSVSPHRQNCLVYIPEYHLEPGTVVDIFDKNDHLRLEVKDKQNGFIFFKSPKQNIVLEHGSLKDEWCEPEELPF